MEEHVQHKNLKSELQRNRKEHAHRVLQEKSIEKSKTRWVLEKEFLSVPVFYNNLPSVSSGPFFKNMDLPHSFADYATYNLSTLEKSYVWKPHLLVDLIDLVDQESVLISENIVSTSNLIDTKLLGPSNDRARRGDAIMNKSLPWLKRTTYLTNDLFASKTRSKQEVDSETVMETSKKLKNEKSLFSKENVEISFDAVESQTIQHLERKRCRSTGGGIAPTIQWSLPILPDTDLVGQILSMIQFDINPATIMSESTSGTDRPSGGETILDGDDQQVMKKRVLSSVFANIRSNLSAETGATTPANFFAVSLIAPSAESLAQLESLAEFTSHKSGESSSVCPILYEWIRDYRMEIFSQFKETGTFFINANCGRNAATFCQLLSKLELKKLSTEDSDPYEANVLRRDSAIAPEAAVVEAREEDADMPAAADEIGEEEE